LTPSAASECKRFDITYHRPGGKETRKGRLSREPRHQQPTPGNRLHAANAAEQRHNVILRPPRPERAELVQLDDLSQDAARSVTPCSFIVLCTSPRNFQAWVAVSDSQPDFARRLRKGARADPSASGATRISGHPNFKTRYALNFPLVEITETHPARVVTRAALEPPKPAPFEFLPRAPATGNGRAMSAASGTPRPCTTATGPRSASRILCGA
jgi:RepB DNA-primase from phage plasmid